METDYKGYTIKVWPEEDPMNPRTDWDNLGTMLCFHRRYSLGDKHDYDLDDARVLEGRIPKSGGVVLPLYLYDHSGITIRTHPFSCPWDSGKIGFIYAGSDKIRKEYGWKRITKARREKIEAYLRAEVQTYDDYLTGNVYGYIVENPEGEAVDSCSGYYGDPEESGLMDAARSIVDSYFE
jgi:hypothetical protein